MPFFRDSKHSGRDLEDLSRREYLDAVNRYDAGDTSAAGVSMAQIVRRLHAHYGRPSHLIGNASSAKDSVFFACVDLLGRSLRKMWCLKEAERVFAAGIRWALQCPQAHLWAHEYYSRWVSTRTRMDHLAGEKDGQALWKLGKMTSTIVRGRGEASPDESVLREIRAILDEVGAVHPHEDELLLELREYARQDMAPDFAELARRAHFWGWKDEPFVQKSE